MPLYHASNELNGGSIESQSQSKDSKISSFGQVAVKDQSLGAQELHYSTDAALLAHLRAGDTTLPYSNHGNISTFRDCTLPRITNSLPTFASLDLPLPRRTEEPGLYTADVRRLCNSGHHRDRATTGDTQRYLNVKATASSNSKVLAMPSMKQQNPHPGQGAVDPQTKEYRGQILYASTLGF